MSRLIRILLVIIVLAVLMYLAYTFYPKLRQGVSLMSADTVQVLVIDNKNQHIVGEEDGLIGDDLILAYIPDPMSSEEFDPELITMENLTDLLVFDTNKNGYIDRSDPIYPRLYLGSLDLDGEVIQFVSLSKAAIVAIRFDPALLRAASKSPQREFTGRVGSVHKSDDSRGQLKLAPMNITIIDDFTSKS